MNNQLKPTPNAKPIQGTVTQPKPTDPHAPIKGAGSQDKETGNMGVKNSVTFAGDKSAS